MWTGIAAGAGALAGGLGGLFGGLSSQHAADQYQQQMNDLAKGYLPYQQRGTQMEDASKALNLQQMQHPAALENMLALSYQNSPYQTQILDQMRHQMNTNAAQTGLLNSTAQQKALQNALAGQQNQFQQQYIDRGIGQYNLGFGGYNQLASQMAQRGFNALDTGTQLRAQGDMAQLQQGMRGNPWTQALSGALGGGAGVLSMFKG